MAGLSASAFSAAEMEFLQEDEMIEIVPNMKMEPLNFISRDFGPFRPQIPTQVPLWLAVSLRKREKLMQVLEAERNSEKFQPLPFHYVELSRFLFDHAREEIPDIYMDIKDVRFSQDWDWLGNYVKGTKTETQIDERTQKYLFATIRIRTSIC